MASRPSSYLTMGREAQAQPSVQPGAVNFGVQPTPFVRAAQLDLEGLSRATAFFVRDSERAMDKFQGAALLRQRKETAAFEETMSEKGAADAHAGATADPEANQFYAYSHAFRTIKGQNTGADAFGRFIEQAAKAVPPDADPVEYARQWADKNPFTIGDDKFDARALSAFDQKVQQWALNERGQRVRAAAADGVVEIERSVGNLVVGMELTPEGLQGLYAQARALMPHDPNGASKMVVSAALSAATTPEQQQHVMAILETPGSFAPGVSFSQQFPVAYQAQVQHAERQRADRSRWRQTEAFAGLEDVITEMQESGNPEKAKQALAELYRYRDEFGDGPQFKRARAKLEKAIGKVASGIAWTNTVETAISNPDLRGNVIPTWKKDGAEFLAGQGYDPLSSAPLPNGVPSYLRAAQAVAAFGAIPSGTHDVVSQALLTGDSPERQAAAFGFLKAVEAQRGEAFTLSLLPEYARPLYQAAAGGIAPNGDAVSWFRTFGSPNEKREDDGITFQRVTGAPTLPAAKKKANEALTSALNDHLGTGGWFSSSISIAPEVADRLVADLQRSSVHAARTGTFDLERLAKDAVKRMESNIQVVPGEGGKGHAVWSGPPPVGTSDQPAVRLGRRVMNPLTGKEEDTTATAEKDLRALSTAMPTVAGSRDRLALYMPPPSTQQGLIYQQRGVIPVVRGGQPIMLRPGDEIAFEAGAVPPPQPRAMRGDVLGGSLPDTQGKAPRGPAIKLSADPIEAARQFSTTHPNVPFKLLPLTVMDPETKRETFIYQMTYAPRFTETGQTVAQREAAFGAKQAAEVATNAEGATHSANRPQLWTPEEERRRRGAR